MKRCGISTGRTELTGIGQMGKRAGKQAGNQTGKQKRTGRGCGHSGGRCYNGLSACPDILRHGGCRRLLYERLPRKRTERRS
ncbi:hypothetical protein B5G27_06915 [Lachnoclostridium sp. An76]|nr:hypothetical protein B5G27_06915 [Lachnoclostridium sp. An76]